MTVSGWADDHDKSGVPLEKKETKEKIKKSLSQTNEIIFNILTEMS